MTKIGKNIRKLREEKEMTQQQLSDELGISRPSVSDLENGSRQISAAELGKIAQLFEVSADELLGLKKPPEICITHEKGEEEVAESIRISIPKKNIEKFKEVLLYILNKVGSKPNVGQVVIYKLLYFIDFNFYEMYEEQLIGATYQKNEYGPTPMEFKLVVDQMLSDGDIEKVKSEYFKFPQQKYLPKRRADISKFSAHEIELIDNVLTTHSDKTAKQISEYSHDDIPWKATPGKGVIDYELVFYRTPEYSVREYEDELRGTT